MEYRYKESICGTCGQHLGSEKLLTYYEKQLDEKAERVATLMYEVETLRRQLQRKTRHNVEVVEDHEE